MLYATRHAFCARAADLTRVGGAFESQNELARAYTLQREIDQEALEHNASLVSGSIGPVAFWRHDCLRTVDPLASPHLTALVCDAQHRSHHALHSAHLWCLSA